MDLEEFIEIAEKIDMSAIINDAVKQKEFAITQLNTENQLYEKGIDEGKSKLKPSYAKSTIAIKNRKHQPTDRVTLRDTGKFYKAWTIFYERDQITLMAKPMILNRNFDLVAHLEHRYGQKIIGLTPENIEKLRKLVLPLIITKIQAKVRTV